MLKLLATCLILILVFGPITSMIAETETVDGFVTGEVTESVVEEKLTKESAAVSEQKLLGETELQILGAELQGTGIRLRKAYNSFSVVPGTWHRIWKEVDKGNTFEAVLLTVVILPIDFTVSRFYGNFAGSYQLGKAGDHLIAGSNVFPAEQTVLMENSGKNLKISRTCGLFSNALFYGGIIGVLVHDYGSSDEGGSSFPYIPIGVMATGAGLRLLSARYVDSAGARLQDVSKLPLADPLKEMNEVGVKLGNYATSTYLGQTLAVLGITIAVAGRDDDTALKVGLLTAGLGWIISSPVAVSNIKGAAIKLQEVGDRLTYWKE